MNRTLTTTLPVHSTGVEHRERYSHSSLNGRGVKGWAWRRENSDATQQGGAQAPHRSGRAAHQGGSDSRGVRFETIMVT